MKRTLLSKISAIFLASLLLVSVAACDNAENTESDTETVASEIEKSTDTEKETSSETDKSEVTDETAVSETDTETATDDSSADKSTETETESDTNAESQPSTETETVGECCHEYGEGEVLIAPSCTEKGEKILTCLVCGETKTEEIATIDHTYNDGVTVTAATCESEGVLRKSCTECGSIKDEVIAKNNNHTCESGWTFSENERRVMSDNLPAFPQTFSASFKINKTEGVSSHGILFSNNDHWYQGITYKISKSGCPQIVVVNTTSYFKSKTYTFNQLNVCTGKTVNMSIVIDRAKAEAHCYINGEKVQTLTGLTHLTDSCVTTNPYVIGGDHHGGNFAHFLGEIYSISVWSDIRTDAEIAEEAKGSVISDDDALMVRYEFYSCKNDSFDKDLSKNGNDIKTVKLRLDPSEVTEVTDGYCFAVVGDTQSLSQYSPESVTKLYDWLVNNKEEKRIEYVIGVGDITEDSSKAQFDHARDQIYKLSGVVPFSLVMGNHDKYDFKAEGYIPENYADYLFNKTFCNETYLKELDGWRGEGDVSCSYNAFEIGETKWLLVNLDFGVTDDMIEWASNVIEQYPDHNVVIATHAYLFRNGTTLDQNECYPPANYNDSYNNGDEVFDKLVSKYANIKLVLCGHDPWDHIVCAQDKGENGNTVTQLLIDPQYMDKNYGPTAMVALLYFSEDGKTMTVRYYSVESEMYGSELSQFTVSLE